MTDPGMVVVGGTGGVVQIAHAPNCRPTGSGGGVVAQGPYTPQSPACGPVGTIPPGYGTIPPGQGPGGAVAGTIPTGQGLGGGPAPPDAAAIAAWHCAGVPPAAMQALRA